MARVAVAALALWVIPLHAEELRIDMNAGSYAEFNDNPRLVDGDVDPVSGIVTDAGMNVGWGGDTWRWNLAPRFKARRYTGAYDLDSRDIDVNTGYERTLERGSYQVGAGYVRQSTLTSDFSTTGAVDSNVPRELASINGALMHAFTERLAGNLQLSYQDVTYDDGLRYGLFDYQYWSALAYTQFSLSERSSANVIVRFADLDVPVTGGGSREMSIGLGYERSWHERWTVSLAAGPSFSDVNGGGRNVGASWRVAATGAGERSQVQFGVERLLSPNAGQGRLQTRDALSASYVYHVSQALDANVYVGADLYADVGEDTATARYDSGTSRGGASLAWRPSPHWSWQVGYEHTQRDADGSPQGNRLTAGVSWRGLPRSLSR